MCLAMHSLSPAVAHVHTPNSAHAHTLRLAIKMGEGGISRERTPTRQHPPLMQAVEICSVITLILLSRQASFLGRTSNVTLARKAPQGGGATSYVFGCDASNSAPAQEDAQQAIPKTDQYCAHAIRCSQF